MQSRYEERGAAALVLPGGGARAAYQVGVLKALSELRGRPERMFPIICGTSAGAINAAVLASHAHEFDFGIERLVHFWSSMYCERIYRTDAWSVLKSGAHWLATIVSGGLLPAHPRSLLDNSPLQEFLTRSLRLEGVEAALDEGALTGLAITASAYTQASAVSFYQARDEIEPWQRNRRFGQPARIGVDHLMASAALPLIFPAAQIGNEYFGDGGMRMVAPLSPAIHLGADRILVIGTRDEHPDPVPDKPSTYPSLGEIGGYLLDTIFMDTMNADVARLERINRTLALIPDAERAASGLRPIEALVIRPSRDLRDVTREHIAAIPRSVRTLLRTLGGWGRDWRMASYLLFEEAYCSQLIELGYRDGFDQADALTEFMN
ncbi:MAG: patatin-like phospholipase family protein [Xanthomonadales bacterium]|nr:patatin-like phospholipase family protein [Xanthomonadales bacterium]